MCSRAAEVAASHLVEESQRASLKRKGIGEGLEDWIG